MQWHFGPFQLDRAKAGLWRAEQPVTLRPKTFEMLVYLVTHARPVGDQRGSLRRHLARDGSGRGGAEDQYERIA